MRSVAFAKGLLLAAGTAKRFHGHAHLEVIHFPEASGRSRTTEGVEFAFAPGSTLVYPPHVRHDRAFDVAGRSFVVRIALGEPVPVELRRSFAVRGPLPGWLAAEIASLAATSAIPSGGWARRALDLRAEAVVCGLLELAPSPIAQDAEAALVEQAERWLEAHASAIGRLEEAAGALGVGYDRLRRAFRRHRGRSLGRHLAEIRIRHAQELLAGTRLTLDEIAVRCGYGTASRLGVAFKSLAGRTPGAWRRSAR